MYEKTMYNLIQILQIHCRPTAFFSQIMLSAVYSRPTSKITYISQMTINYSGNIDQAWIGLDHLHFAFCPT